jgi:hypothetical protein
MRRSSIGHPLRSPHSPDAGDEAPFDQDADLEEPEPRSRLSRQRETPRRARLSISEDGSSPNARSKGKRKATEGNDDAEGDNRGDEIAQGLDDVEMQQEDEDEEVTEPPPKKKPAEKRPRKKKDSPVVPCKYSFIMTQYSG